MRTDKDKEILKGNIYFCVAETGGHICGDVDGFVRLITGITPVFGFMLKENYIDEDE